MVSLSNASAGLHQRGQRLLQRRSSSIALLQWLVDAVVVVVTLFALSAIRNEDPFNSYYRILAVATCLLMLISYNRFGVYRINSDALGRLIILFKAWGSVVVALVLLGFVTKTGEIYSRQVIISWFIASFLLQFIAHYLLQSILAKMNSNKTKHPALIVGAGQLGHYLAEKINANPWLNTRIIGVVDDNQEAIHKWDNNMAPVLGQIHNINELIDLCGIRAIYIALPISESKTIEKLYLDCTDKNIDVSWAPDIFGMMLINHSVKELAGVPLISLSESPLTGSHALMKSTFDRVIASMALLVLSPLMTATAIAIKFTSPGKAIYKQKRHGWNGEVFEVFKFRSMRTDIEFDPNEQARKNDPRITPIGRFIRRTSIDELPQLFNVLMGQMSLVGPRPHALEHNKIYSKQIESYLARHKIKPGITGLAQTNGCRGETDTIDKMRKRVEFDLDYINNWSLGLDLKIIIKTVFTLFSKNAY